MTTPPRHGTVLADHTFTVPLDHDRPDAQQIRLYAREVRAAGTEGRDLPWLLFLGGGPGFAAPRPIENIEHYDRHAGDVEQARRVAEHLREYQHDGLRTSDGAVLDRLIRMLRPQE